MQKVFVEKGQVNFETNEIEIQGEAYNHIKNVLRFRVNDSLKIGIKDSQKTYLATLQKIDSDKLICHLEKVYEESTESPLQIDLYQGLPKGDKMESIIQKCTELGIHHIIPVEMKRCVVKLNRKDAEKKKLRWNKIAEAAAMQSQRDQIPEVENKINGKELETKIKNYDMVFVAYEGEKTQYLKPLIQQRQMQKISIVVGPEGGLEETEVDCLKQARC